jgi:hypothetical protein
LGRADRQGSRGRTFSTPTIPISADALTPFSIPECTDALAVDSRFNGKIKWYVNPLVFGGDPKIEENVIWVDHGSHGELVRWWNQHYRELKSNER